MTVQIFVKDPDAGKDYAVDWASWLGTDTIAESEWIVPAGLTQGEDSHTTTKATVWLSGGTDQARYVVTNRITTAAGRTEDQSFIVIVSEATALVELIARLQADVPARDDVPGEAQYRQCVVDAVADYSRVAARRKVVELEIVSGTATYDLPADFQRLIRVEWPGDAASGVLLTSDGIVPVGSSFEEQYYVEGGQIVFWPTPTYNATRDLWYSAGFALIDGQYVGMGQADEATLMHRARALALRLQANKAAHEAWQYAIGDERVNKEKLAAELRAAADAEDRQYEAALAEDSSAPFGMRSRYDRLGR